MNVFNIVYFRKFKQEVTYIRHRRLLIWKKDMHKKEHNCNVHNFLQQKIFHLFSKIKKIVIFQIDKYLTS